MRELSVSELERAIIRNCAPTLATLKPSSLFTFPGRFVDDGSAGDRERALANRVLFHDALSACARQLEADGVRLRALVWRECGALIFLYRPDMLASHLADPRAARPLAAEGYPVGDLEACVDVLAARIACAGKHAVANGGGASRAGRAPGEDEPSDARAADGRGGAEADARAPHGDARATSHPCPCGEEACRRAFPHELGYFLGYPYADVAEFIRQRGENYLALGLWKVYTEQERALETFARYKRCTRSMMSAYRRRGRLAGLAARTR